MPALSVYGKFWHLAADDVPLFAMFGAVFHAAWVIVIGVTGREILTLPNHCHHDGKQYIAFISGMLLAFIWGFLMEILLIYQGFQGAVFEISKRKRMPLLLTIRFFNLIAELVFTAYGTFVVFGTRLHCKISDTVVLDPKKESMILIILTWSFELLTVLNAALWYNFWPDNNVAERWENRFAWIGRYMCCHFKPYANSKGRESRAYQQSLRKIARWVHKILGKLDLTPSDSAVAVILVHALQRKARREKIEKSLAAASASYGLVAHSLMERANSISTLPMKNAGSISVPIVPSSSRMSEADVIEVSPPEGGSGPPVPVKMELLAGLVEQGCNSREAVEQVDDLEKAVSIAVSELQTELGDESVRKLSQRLKNATTDQTKQQAETFVRSLSRALTNPPPSSDKSDANEDDALLPPEGRNQNEENEASTSGSWPLNNFYRQMRTMQRSCLTPSGMDEELRGFRTAEEAVQIYTGSHWKVPAGLLQEVSYFARYAIGVYSFDPEAFRDRESWWAWMKKVCFRIKETVDPSEKQRIRMKGLYEDLFFQDVRQKMEATSELLYVSIQNEALTHLPYIISLDHASRSVVVAIRGTWSMEDIITDSVASAQCLKDWLPIEFKQEHGEESEQMWAHSGIVGVADGILIDLEANGILSTLLGGEQAHPEQQSATRGEGEKGTSNNQEARQAAGHFIAEVMSRKLDCSGWKLVITGHSLGGGAAALIALKLCGRFKDVRCWSFCPPGGLMSKNLSKAVEPFVTSVAVGKDVVPRLSVVNIGRLIDQMVAALALCKYNKNVLLLRKFTSFWRHQRVDDLFYKPEEVPQEALDVLQEYAELIEARSRMIELVPPGQVILLRALKINSERHSWDAIWVKAEELIREGILISPSMANDHYAVTLQAALARAQGFVDDESVWPSYCPPSLSRDSNQPSSSAFS